MKYLIDSPRRRALVTFASLLGLCACAEDPESAADTDDQTSAGDLYAYESRFDGADSVTYAGQTLRQVLIHDLTEAIASLTPRIDEQGEIPVDGAIVAELIAYYDFDSNGDLVDGAAPHGIETDPAPLQPAYADIGEGKNLSSKIAGADTDGHQHLDWEQGFVGWGSAGSVTPDGLVREWFATVEALAIARAQGELVLDPLGQPVEEAYIDAQGRDYKELTQKFLLGAVAFSQGTDDYLDEGLDADNVEADEGSNFTALEHGWDEAFGYFGATRDFGDYSDEEIAGKGGRDDYAKGYHDTDGDGAIDLEREIVFGHATNAAKRDLGSNSAAPTDLTGAIFAAFGEGRAIIAAAEGPLDAEQRQALALQRDIIVENWEAAIAATVVHYINEVVHDLEKVGSDEYDFAAHAQHWSELKGFALSFQFNPRSPLSDQDFAQLHELVKDAPVLTGEAALAASLADLLAARALIGDAYGLDVANLGDEHGEGGW